MLNGEQNSEFISIPKSKKLIANNIIILAITSVISRLLGFGKELIVANYFGVSRTTDTYYIALTIPELVKNILIGGSISASFLPIISEYLSKENIHKAKEFSSTVITLATSVLIVFILLAIISSPILVGFIAPVITGYEKDITITMARILFPIVIFHVISSFILAILHSKNLFKWPAWVEVIISLLQLLLLFIFAPKFGVISLAIAYLLISIIKLFFMFRLQKRYLWELSFSWKPNHPRIKKLLSLMLPVILTTSVNQLFTPINRFFASSFKGGITAINFANKINQLPLGVISLAVSTVLYPIMTKHISLNKDQMYERIIYKGLELIAFFLLPIMPIFLVLGENIISIIFERGEFNSAAVTSTSNALSWIGLTLFAMAGINLLTRAFYAEQDSNTPLMINIGYIVLHIILCWVLVPIHSYIGIAIASAISTNVVFLIFLVLFFSRSASKEKIKISTFQIFKMIIFGIMPIILSEVVFNQQLMSIKDNVSEIMYLFLYVLVFYIYWLLSCRFFGIDIYIELKNYLVRTVKNYVKL